MSSKPKVQSPKSKVVEVRWDGRDWPEGVHAARLTRHVSRHAFTLIEIMIVIGIMGIIMTMGVPIVWRVFHPAPMNQAIKDIIEVCSNARARAILHGQETEVVFYPHERRFAVNGSAAPVNPKPAEAPSAPAAAAPVPEMRGPPGGSGLSGQFSDHLLLEMLDVNLTEYKDQDEAHVRFYPNGTCDELTIILRSDRNEWKKISLEITTGLASVSDSMK